MNIKNQLRIIVNMFAFSALSRKIPLKIHKVRTVHTIISQH